MSSLTSRSSIRSSSMSRDEGRRAILPPSHSDACPLSSFNIFASKVDELIVICDPLAVVMGTWRLPEPDLDEGALESKVSSMTEHSAPG